MPLMINQPFVRAQNDQWSNYWAGIFRFGSEEILSNRVNDTSRIDPEPLRDLEAVEAA